MLDSDRFDIVAKAPPTTSEATLRLMLRTLLAERFKLAVHTEDKVVPVYALAVGKHSPKLKESDGKAPSECKMQVIEGIRTFVCHNIASPLRPARPSILPRPVQATVKS